MCDVCFSQLLHIRREEEAASAALRGGRRRPAPRLKSHSPYRVRGTGGQRSPLRSGESFNDESLYPSSSAATHPFPSWRPPTSIMERAIPSYEAMSDPACRTFFASRIPPDELRSAARAYYTPLDEPRPPQHASSRAPNSASWRRPQSATPTMSATTRLTQGCERRVLTFAPAVASDWQSTADPHEAATGAPPPSAAPSHADTMRLRGTWPVTDAPSRARAGNRPGSGASSGCGVRTFAPPRSPVNPLMPIPWSQHRYAPRPRSAPRAR